MQTAIWYEKPNIDNPYLADSCYMHGYDVAELLAKRSYFEVLGLLFCGELLEHDKAVVFEKLAIALMNLGPRHPAVRAAMIAGVSKTKHTHILPTGLLAGSGGKGGASEVELAMVFIERSRQKYPVLSDVTVEYILEDTETLHGFGDLYGDRDVMANQFIHKIFESIELPDQFPYLSWLYQFNQYSEAKGVGVLIPGLAAAVFADIGVKPRESVALFQILISPGIAAQGMEQSHLPITAMPFIDDESYVFEK